MIADVDQRILVALGDAIRRQRVTLGFSQESFAEKVGLHRTYIGSVERGERNVSLINLARIATALGITASELLVLSEKEMDDSSSQHR